MSFQPVRLLALALLLPLAAPAADNPATGGKIKKCQDATGKWHYGDSAAAECARSKVVEISEHGTTKRVVDAPLTEEELHRRATQGDEVERKKREAADQRKKDELLLATYGHEQDIIYVRDRKLAQLEPSIKASNETLKSLRGLLTRLEAQAADESRGGGQPSEQTVKQTAQTKAQIAKHEAVVEAKHKEQEQIRQQAEADMERYREIKKGTATRTAAPGATK